jgi:hypothetical protein
MPGDNYSFAYPEESGGRIEEDFLEEIFGEGFPYSFIYKLLKG